MKGTTMKLKLLGCLLLTALLAGCYVVPAPPCPPKDADPNKPTPPCPPAAFYIYPWPGY
jgi:hypothetical protein